MTLEKKRVLVVGMARSGIAAAEAAAPPRSRFLFYRI